MSIWKKTMDAKDIEVTFYFISGENMKVSLEEETYNEIMSCLEKCWNSSQVIGDGWGINFSLVTHYKVKE